MSKKIRGRVIAGAIVSIALLFGSLPAIAAVATATTPVGVSSALLSAHDANVAVDSSGRATAIWVGQVKDGGAVIQSSTSVKGGTWSPPVNLTPTEGVASLPQVTVDSAGLATAIWCFMIGDNYVVQSSTSLNGGAWSPPVDLSPSELSADVPQLTVDSAGRVVAVWWVLRDSHEIIQSSSSVSGGAWSAPVELTASNQIARQPQVTVDSTGLATAVWQFVTSDSAGSFQGIIRSSTSLNGAEWSPSVDVSATDANAGEPQVAVDSSGLATAMWNVYRDDQLFVQSGSSRSGGPWSNPVDVSGTDTAKYESPQLVVDSAGRATAVWTHIDSFGAGFIQSSTSVSGGEWSAPVELSAGFAKAPKVTVDSSGHVTAVWSSNDGSAYSVQTSFSVNGGEWSTPINLSEPDTYDFVPEVTADSSGQVTAIWIFSDGTVQSSNVSYSGATDSGETGSGATQPDSSGDITGTLMGLAGILALVWFTVVVVVLIVLLARSRKKRARILTSDGS